MKGFSSEMTRSSDSLIPSAEGQSSVEKWDDKASAGQAGGEANARAATQVNAVSASLTPPVSNLTQLELFPGRACPLKAKPATSRNAARIRSTRRDGVEGGGTRRQHSKITGETLFGPTEEFFATASVGREAYKGSPRNRRNEAEQGVGGGHSTCETRDNRVEGRTAASTRRTKRGKATGLPPRGKAPSRPKTRRRRPPQRMDKARKLQRTLYRVAKSQPERRLTLLYDKICRIDILEEAWRGVRSNGGAAGIDCMSIEAVRDYGEERFLQELLQELRAESYRVSPVRRVHIPKSGQPGRTRPLGIPTVKDRVVQMAVKLVIEPLFEADFCPCSYGFRPKRTPRMALGAITKSLQAGSTYVVDVDLKSYFDTIDHDLLMDLVGRRVGDVRILRLIRAWLKAGVMEEGKVRHPNRGSPQGGVISPVLSNIVLHEVDRQWCTRDGQANPSAHLVRYADDMVLLANTADAAQEAWERLQQQFAQLRLVVNEEKSRVTTLDDGFAFLGFEFRRRRGRIYLWPRMKARKSIMERVRQKVRSFRSSEPLAVVIQALNPVLWGWCTYFRIGHSNRTFHTIDWAVRQEIQLWLRRKHRCSWRHAQTCWNYQVLHASCRLYRMVGKVSHLEGL